MKNVPIYIILFLVFAFNLNSQPWIDQLPQGKLQNGELTFYEIQKAFNDYWEPYDVKNGYYEVNGEQVKAPYWKQYKRWEWYWENRIDPETGKFPETSAWEELQKFNKEKPGAKSSSGTWTSMGPTATSGGYAGLGRLNCVTFVPDDNNTIYVGAASGGIWKTTNGGSTWAPLGDNNPVLGVSDIVVYRPVVGADIIYIATGDRDGGSMWSLGGGQYNDNNSVGVLKSTDGGTTWNTTGLSWNASQQRTVNRLLMDPSNINIVYAATSVGLYKTTNAGSSWTLLTSTHFVDIKFNTASSAILYGSTYGGDIYRSTNSGVSWSIELSTSNGRTELAVSANNSSIVYAVMESGGGLAGVYKSTNSGDTYTQVFSGTTTNMLNWDCNSTATGGQGSYDLCIAADPTNVNNVFVGGVNTWRSSNGGTSWSITNHWTSSWGCGVSEVHADQHFLAYQNGTSTLFECNDGGLYKTTNNGSSWTHHGSGLVTSQIYRLGTAQTSSNDVIIGLQDNGTKALLSGSWSDELGGDGFECAYDWSNHNVMYGELYYGDIRRSTNHGGSWSSITTGLTGSAHWCAPFVIDPNVNTTLYMGYQDVFKSTNQGTSWSSISSWGGSTIRSIAVGPSNSNYIYAATQSNLYRTTNGGTSWSSNLAGSLPTGSGSITYISVKDTDPNTIWVSLGGYNSYGVYQTTDGGANWTNISVGLPAIPVMCVIQNKENTAQDELYAGTDVGVYVKVGSSTWSPFSSGLPNVVVTELDIYYDEAAPVNSRLRAATYGRGLWESDLYSGNVPPIADFSASTTSPAINTDVVFTDLSTNVPTSWNWVFNPSTVVFVNGTNASSQNPEVQFTELVPHTVTLVATNSFGNDIEIKTNYINPINCTYCTTSYSNTLDEWISNVSFNTISNPSGSTSYSDFTAISTDVDPGSSYAISVEITVAGSYTENCIVFIDWDHDCDFTDIDEIYDLGQVAGSGTLNSTIDVPLSVQPGPTRMRVSMRYSSDPTGCDVTSYGEAEDYTVNVTESHVTLDLKAYLEGPFNGTNMNASIISDLPLSQPFNTTPWNYSGPESVGSIPNANVVDWVLIDVRDAASVTAATGSTSVAKQAAFLLRDGSIVDLDGSSNLQFDISISQNMFVVVWQRNHLGIISNNALPSSGGVYTYDFTTGINQVYGGTNGHNQIGSGVWGMIGGDGNHNGVINVSDKSTSWENEAGEQGYIFSDYNLDGESNNKDKDDIWVPNEGKSSQVPN